MTDHRKAALAMSMAGYATSLFDSILESGKPADALTRLAAAVTETPPTAEGKRPTRQVDAIAVAGVVADYYEAFKATSEGTDKAPAPAAEPIVAEPAAPKAEPTTAAEPVSEPAVDEPEVPSTRQQ